MTKAEYLELASKNWDKIKQLESIEENFYDFEKKFEELMLEHSQDLLSDSLGKESIDRRKKKITTRFGRISIDKSHKYYEDCMESKLSPYLQELSLYLGQEECYETVSKTLEHLLHVKVNGMQIQRQVMKYGLELEKELHQVTPCVDLESNEKVYAMMDGAMILTRETGWKEVKLGRVFKEKSIHSESKSRNWIRSSEYVGHLGDHKSFETKFSLIVDKYETLKKDLVFINDGARWIWNYIDAEFPNSTQILDYYHAVEHLSSFAKRKLKSIETGSNELKYF